MISDADIYTFLEDELGLDTDEIAPDTLLFSTGIIDSFALVTMMAYLEATAGLKIKPMDVNLDNLDSIERIVAFAVRAAA